MDIKNIIVVLTLPIVTTVVIRYKKDLLVPFIIALIAATLWTFYYRYEYVGSNLFIFNRINVYTLVLWTSGLTMLQFLHVHIMKRYSIWLTALLYLLILGSLEAVGYYLLNIQLNSNYTSLLGLGIIHAPLRVKIFYLAAGPAYLLLQHMMYKRYPGYLRLSSRA